MGKLGFFDSGIGGLTVMRSFEKLYPDFDMVYFGDRSHCPYGNKTSEEIFELTLHGVLFLISQGASIIILACNTAVSHAIWRLQNEIFPPGSGVKILGITLPGAEKIKESDFRHVTVLATSATVLSGAYRSRVKILSPNTQVHEIALPGLVDEIEQNPKIESVITTYSNTNSRDEEVSETPLVDLSNFLQQIPLQELNISATDFLEQIADKSFGSGRMSLFLEEYLIGVEQEIDAVILGCTHYPLVKETIAAALKNLGCKGFIFVDPGESAAEKFSDYLKRHSEFQIRRNGEKSLFFSKKN